MVEAQPMKMAAAEALWYTEDPASFSLITIGDLSQRREVFSIRLPFALSLLATDQLTGEVQGIYDLQAHYQATHGPGNYIPPVAVIYWTFRIMVGAGIALVALGFYALFMVMGDTVRIGSRTQKIFFVGLFLPYAANTAGWLMTEIGRFPWIVQDLMKIEDAVSRAVPAGQVLTTLIGFTLLYGLLMFADIYLLVKYARIIPSVEDDRAAFVEDAELSLVAAQD
jgi:cytochrome d ubiquinol oxidase subunit I